MRPWGLRAGLTMDFVLDEDGKWTSRVAMESCHEGYTRKMLKSYKSHPVCKRGQPEP